VAESDLIALKKRLRGEAKRCRAALAEAAPDFSVRIDRILADSTHYHRHATISGYWPMPDEADIRPILQRLHTVGRCCALPIVVRKAQPLLFRRWTPDCRLEVDRFGISVPAPDAPTVVPDLLLVPLLAFDREGYRLGYGGGFYDCTLAALRREKPIVALGVAFSGQEVDAVPHEPHDERLDGVLTEQGLRTF